MQSEDLKEKFEDIYEREIKPNFSPMEAFRLRLMRKYIILTCLFIIVLIIAISCFVYISQNASSQNELVATLAMIFVVSPVIMFFFLANDTRNEYRKKIKEKFLTHILSVFGNFKILTNSNITLREIKSLGMYPMAANMDADDIIAGEYKEKPLAFLEARFSHTEGSGKNRRVVIDFDGLIISTKIDRNFKGKGNIYSKGDWRAQSSTLFDTKKTEEVHLEDTEFEKQYKVIADDQVEIRYLLTPTFMERIKNLKDIIGVRHINLSFNMDHLYIFLNGIKINTAKKIGANVSIGHGLFEVGDVMHSVTDKRIYRKAFFELTEIFNFVDFINEAR